MGQREVIATSRLWRGFVERLDRGTSGLAVWWSARWWRVECSSGCRFYGVPVFRRARGSRIVVGARCRFRSRQSSNLIGLDRKCMLSTLRAGAAIEIGSESGFSGTTISAAERVVVGSRVLCGANVTITDTDWHGLELRDRRETREVAPVVIEDDVWLGLGVLVLKGVTIGRGTVVAAGSVVTHSLPAMVLAAGNPASVVRELDDVA